MQSSLGLVVEGMLLFFVPTLIVVSFFLLVAYLVLEKIRIILRLKRRENRKAIIKRWKRWCKIRKAERAKFKKGNKEI